MGLKILELIRHGSSSLQLRRWLIIAAAVCQILGFGIGSVESSVTFPLFLISSLSIGLLIVLSPKWKSAISSSLIALSPMPIILCISVVAPSLAAGAYRGEWHNAFAFIGLGVSTGLATLGVFLIIFSPTIIGASAIKIVAQPKKHAS